ncbi:MAG: class I SAM-dependent methyltransferase [Pseudonocardia sp.]|nr:class I SAM-dependent methyltransferase [Pseudonocardia sp.]
MSRSGAVRGWVYNRAITGLTTGWYRAVLDRLPTGARVLDVGIGTGAALGRNADRVRELGLKVTGLDIDRDYHERCVAEVERSGLAGYVTPRLESVYDHRGGPYDAVYFSASLMLLPDPVAALRHVTDRLAVDGRVFCTQTFHHRRSPVRERLKPLLRHVVTIDFGRVTYEDEFRRVVDAAGLQLRELVTLGATRTSSYRLAVAAPYRAAA